MSRAPFHCRRGSSIAAIAAGLASAALSGCVSAPPLADGTPAVVFIAQEVARVVRVCAQEDFARQAVRERLIAEGFVEHNRFGTVQLERFPEHSGLLTQGVAVLSSEPCTARVNAMFARASLDAAGKALIAEGFTPSEDAGVLIRGGERIRPIARYPAIGGLARISMDHV